MDQAIIHSLRLGELRQAITTAVHDVVVSVLADQPMYSDILKMGMDERRWHLNSALREIAERIRLATEE